MIHTFYRVDGIKIRLSISSIFSVQRTLIFVVNHDLKPAKVQRTAISKCHYGALHLKI
jgi:hypothetical protein